MSLQVRVEHGTNAGRRRPPAEPAGDWKCSCLVNPRFPEAIAAEIVFRTQPGYRLNCPDCGSRRPAR